MQKEKKDKAVNNAVVYGLFICWYPLTPYVFSRMCHPCETGNQEFKFWIPGYF